MNILSWVQRGKIILFYNIDCLAEKVYQSYVISIDKLFY